MHRLPPVRDLLSVGALAAVVGYLFRIHEGREFLEQPTVGQARHRRRRADVPLQHHDDGAEGPQDRDHQRAAARPVGHRDLLPVLALQSRPTSRSTRCTGGTSSTLGRGRVGTGHGLDPRLPDAQAHRRRSRSGREVALRHRRRWRCSPALLGTGHHYYWIGAPGLLAVDRLDLLDARSRCRSSPWCCSPSPWCGRAGAIIPTRPRCCGRSAASVLAFFGAGVWGFMHTLSSDQLLHPRHAGDGGARPSRLLRRLCDAEPRDHDLCHSRTCSAAQPYNQVLNMVELLADVARHGVHDLHADLRRRGADPSAAGAWAWATWTCRTSSALFYWMRLGAGVVVLLGVLMFVYAILVPGAKREADRSRRRAVAGAGGITGKDAGVAVERERRPSGSRPRRWPHGSTATLVPTTSRSADECEVFETAYRQPAAAAAQGADRLRQDALRRAHGGAARAAAAHRRPATTI